MIDLANIGINFFTKFAVSKGTLWALGLTVFLKFLDMFVDWRKADKEMKERYVKFVSDMSAKNLVSAKFKKSAQEQIDELNKSQ